MSPEANALAKHRIERAAVRARRRPSHRTTSAPWRRQPLLRCLPYRPRIAGDPQRRFRTSRRVIALFQQHFVKAGGFPADTARALHGRSRSGCRQTTGLRRDQRRGSGAVEPRSTNSSTPVSSWRGRSRRHARRCAETDLGCGTRVLWIESPCRCRVRGRGR